MTVPIWMSTHSLNCRTRTGGALYNFRLVVHLQARLGAHPYLHVSMGVYTLKTTNFGMLLVYVCRLSRKPGKDLLVGNTIAYHPIHLHPIIRAQHTIITVKIVKQHSERLLEIHNQIPITRIALRQHPPEVAIAQQHA